MTKRNPTIADALALQQACEETIQPEKKIDEVFGAVSRELIAAGIEHGMRINLQRQIVIIRGVDRKHEAAVLVIASRHATKTIAIDLEL